MKRTALFFLISLFSLSSFAICSGDSRSFTEVLFQNKDITIFKCKILSYDKGFYSAEVLQTYLGTTDGNKVKLKTLGPRTPMIYKIGEEVLIYSSGTGKEFSLNGTCSDMNKVISSDPNTQHELKTLAEFADIFKNKKSGDFKFYFAGKKLAAEGKYTNGQATGLWKHFYENGQLKTEQDFEKNYSNFYAENGFISSSSRSTKDSTVNLIYSIKNKGAVTYKFVDIPNDSGFVSVNYEYFENKNVKLIQSLAYRVKGNTTSFLGTYGKYYEFYDNGKLKISGAYNNSKRVGVWKNFDKDGKMKTEFDFKDGNAKP
jgi:antitoxin component YwqK of YwqJK toxin-antitoxin module